jgi:hypothetical protein
VRNGRAGDQLYPKWRMGHQGPWPSRGVCCSLPSSPVSGENTASLAHMLSKVLPPTQILNIETRAYKMCFNFCQNQSHTRLNKAEQQHRRRTAPFPTPTGQSAKNAIKTLGRHKTAIAAAPSGTVRSCTWVATETPHHWKDPVKSLLPPHLEMWSGIWALDHQAESKGHSYFLSNWHRISS